MLVKAEGTNIGLGDPSFLQTIRRALPIFLSTEGESWWRHNAKGPTDVRKDEAHSRVQIIPDVTTPYLHCNYTSVVSANE